MTGPGQDPSLPVRRPWLAPLLVLAVLAVWWAVLLPRAEQSVFARVPVLDEVYYLDRADDPRAESGHFVTPLYPRLIALTGSGLTNPDIEVVPPVDLRGIRLLQVACWLGVVVLLHLTARRVLGAAASEVTGGRWLLWLPSLLFVLYRPASVYAVTVLLELPLVFLMTLHLYLLTWAGEGPDRRRLAAALLAGLSLGLAALLRGSAVALLPVGLWVFWRAVPVTRLRAVVLAVLTAAVILPLLPASVHNSQVAGRLSGPTFNGGVNLYVGNGPEANGFYVAAVPGDWRRDPAGREFLARRLDLPEVSLARADSIWTAEAVAAMQERPLRTGRLWLKKVWLHLQGWEIDQLTPLAGWRREVPLLGVLLVPYGLLVVLGLAGGVVGWAAWPGLRPWVWQLGLLLAVQSVFFVVSRYRLAVVPLLCLLAGAGLLHMVRLLPRRQRRWWLWPAAAAAALLLVYPWGLGPVKERWVPLAWANEARRWSVIGEQEKDPAALERAARLYRTSVAAQPDVPGPWLGLATTLQAQGRRQEAQDVLAGAILRVEGNLDLRRMLVGMMIEDGRRSDALVQAQALLRAYPDDAETLHNATVLLADLGNLPAALDMAHRLVGAHPDDPRGALDLGVLLARSGRRDEARAAFEEGLRHNPEHPGLLHNLQLLDRSP